MLNNDNFDRCKVKNEFEMIYEYVRCFKSNAKPVNYWPAIFNLRLQLGINNAFIIEDICLVTTLSNAESKRVLTFL